MLFVNFNINFSYFDNYNENLRRKVLPFLIITGILYLKLNTVPGTPLSISLH